MTEKKELNEQDLEGITGGNGGRGAMGIYCACGCRRLYTANAFCWPANGTVLGTCSNGWKATIDHDIYVKFYNEALQQTKNGTFSSSY